MVKVSPSLSEQGKSLIMWRTCSNLSMFRFDYEAIDIVMTARYPDLKWWQQEVPNDKAIVEKAMKELGLSPAQSICTKP